MPIAGRRTVAGAAKAESPTAKADRPKAKADRPKGKTDRSKGKAEQPAADLLRSTATAGVAPASVAAGDWGQELAYPDWMRRWMPALHGSFNGINKYMSVPALRMGLGRYMSNPLTGYLMILQTRGRKTGELRDAPLGYTIVGDHVYCIAGFGRRTNWYQNVLADPHVEVMLPSRAFSGIAEEVTDPDERRRVLVRLLRSLGVIAGAVGMGNAWRDSPQEIERKCEGMPLVRVKATGIAAGPDDPGGWFWVVPVAISGWWLLRLLRGRGRSRRDDRARR